MSMQTRHESQDCRMLPICRAVEMVLGGVHDYRAAGKLLDELKSSATDLQPPPKLPAAGTLLLFVLTFVCSIQP